MASFDSVINAVIPWIIGAVGIGIFYKAFKPMIENLSEVFKKITGKFKKKSEEEFLEGGLQLQYE